MKIINLVGARPQIIKSSAVSRAIRNSFAGSIDEIVVHSGQHYDVNMSDIFFREMDIPKPVYNLNMGSGSHGRQTALVIEKFEELLLSIKPDYVIVYGDTNTTLAAGIAASKLHIPLAHIEAGMRSFNKNMPEEINRIVCDHVSTLLFSPTKTGFDNLVREGFNPHAKAPYNIDNPGIFHCGDIMYDNSLYFAQKCGDDLIQSLQLAKNQFALLTIHRPVNTDDKKRLGTILNTIIELSEHEHLPVIFPVHPRTRNKIKELLPQLYTRLEKTGHLKLINPLGFLQMTQLETNCSIIFTDSGGVQKESYFFNKPCVVLRNETEWVELVEQGTAILADASAHKITQAFQQLKNTQPAINPNLFGNGHAAEFICKTILENV